MPNSHRISAADRIALVRVWGPPDVTSAIRAIEDLARDPEFEPHFNVLVDAHALDDGEARLEEIEAVAGSLIELRPRYEGKLAIVCRVGTHFDLMKLMCAYASTQGLRIRAFTETRSARAWLDATDL